MKPMPRSRGSSANGTLRPKDKCRGSLYGAQIACLARFKRCKHELTWQTRWKQLNSSIIPDVGEFVEARGRRWLVEGHRSLPDGIAALSLSCVDDDAQGEMVEVAWSAEIDARLLASDTPETLARDGTDDPSVFSAYLRTLRWSTATAADRDLLQAPFRAGIRLDAYRCPQAAGGAS